MTTTDDFLSSITKNSLTAFEGQKRILSFRQWMDAFMADPVKLGRNAAQYILDCFDHYGIEQVDGVGGKVRRFKLFDAPFHEGIDKLVGHEDVQNRVYELLRRFAATGRSDRLVLLHGPNGSGKTSFIQMMFEGMENYSQLPDGALFRINWIFTQQEGKERLGFGGKADMPKDTYAFLEENLVSCKIPSELRENPVFLIPAKERAKLLDELLEKHKDDPKAQERLNGEFLRGDDLSAKSKSIYEALLNAYRGDWAKVLKHVQIERYFISKRFRQGAAVVEPQQSVDAGARQMAFEPGVTLPPVLQGISMLELNGELIDGCGGAVEFSDILKRPIEMNKYLLTTCERGMVSVHNIIAHLNIVFLGTCNEKYLSAFKANPDFTSFKGRIELVKSGYLREWKKEREIYREYLGELVGKRHVAPHALDVTALWAVMTRLRRPDPSNYPSELGGVLRRLTPLEKARLYGEGKVPEGLNTEEKHLLLSVVPQMDHEHDEETAEFESFTCAAYEGRRGASSREVMSMLAEASQRDGRNCLSPLTVFDSIRNLLRDRSVYDFLRLEPDEGYQDGENHIEEAEERYYNWVSVEIYDSMELVEESEFARRIDEYFRHVRAYVASEKIENPRTGKYDDPSEDVLRGLEKLMTLKESPDGFRRNLMTKIAAFKLEHPKDKIAYAEVFPDLLASLRVMYYKQKQDALESLARHVLNMGTDDDALVPNPERPRVERTMKNMTEKYGYCNACAREAISFMLRKLNDK